jgi:hypothetical protein
LQALPLFRVRVASKTGIGFQGHAPDQNPAASFAHPTDTRRCSALTAKKSDEKSAFWRITEMIAGIAASGMRLDQSKSCLETEASGF